MEDKQAKPLPHEQLQGVDEDEWVSGVLASCVIITK